MNPTTIGKYKIVSTLGQGAMGVVYHAFDPLIKRRVALKTMIGDFSENPELLQRFFLEAQAAGSLRHPNIVTVYDLGEEEQTPFIAMEFLEGSNLQEMMSDEKIRSINHILQITHQCCKGLYYAHTHQIIHRDIKPANIFVLEDGTVKIVDFGIARVGSTTVTQTGMIVGTISYMSPEQIVGKELDGRSDQFSLGIILYEMLTGVKPFAGDSMVEIINKITREPFAPILKKYPHCPQPVRDVVERALSRDLEKRFSNLEEMAREIERILGGLNREYSLDEPVEIQYQKGITLWLDALDEVEEYIQNGDIASAEIRLQQIKRNLGGIDELLDVRVATLSGKIRYIQDKKQVLQRLGNVISLAREGLFEQAESLLEKLEEAYPEAEEIFEARRTVMSEKSACNKFQQIKAHVSQAMVLAESKDYIGAVGLVEELLNNFPEEKSLLGLYKRLVDEKAAHEKTRYRKETFHCAQQLLEAGQLDRAIQRVVEALTAYPEERSFQNLYRTLMGMRPPK